MVTQGYRK